MPLYEFRCEACKITFEELCGMKETRVIQCPDCNGPADKQLTAPGAVVFAQPKGTSREDNFDYVARWNMDNAKEIRRRAEAAAGGGAAPYRAIDDISSGNFFGEVQ